MSEAAKTKANPIRPGAGWKELPWGGIIPAGGTSREFKTGGWRSNRPIWDSEKCISCMTCWLYCPDMAIQVENGKMIGINFDHCKGCGICAAVCPPRVNAITMEPEGA
ncbi:MAG: 4Fe-4S binding protein [Limnochordia bacterium]|jgi:pyruvate ferredoxin oxidoreductase delta subunit